MNELIEAIEAAIRKIIRDEFENLLETKLSDAIENNTALGEMIDDSVDKAIEKYNFENVVKKAVKELDFEVRVY